MVAGRVSCGSHLRLLLLIHFLLVEGWEHLLSHQALPLSVLLALLEEGLGRRWACVIYIRGSFLEGMVAYLLSALHRVGLARLTIVVGGVQHPHVPSSFNQRQHLLFIGVRLKSNVPACTQVWKFLSCLSKLVMALLVRVDLAFGVVHRTMDVGAAGVSQILRMLTVLAQGICKLIGGPYRLLSDGVLLVHHLLLLPNLFKPGVLKG